MSERDYEDIAAELWAAVYGKEDDTPRAILDALQAADRAGYERGLRERLPDSPGPMRWQSEQFLVECESLGLLTRDGADELRRALRDRSRRG